MIGTRADQTSCNKMFVAILMISLKKTPKQGIQNHQDFLLLLLFFLRKDEGSWSAFRNA